MQLVYVAGALLNEVSHEAKVAEDDAGHLGEELLAAGVGHAHLVFDEARDHNTRPHRQRLALGDLKVKQPRFSKRFAADLGFIQQRNKKADIQGLFARLLTQTVQDADVTGALFADRALFSRKLVI